MLKIKRLSISLKVGHEVYKIWGENKKILHPASPTVASKKTFYLADRFQDIHTEIGGFWFQLISRFGESF